jgi:hypothetical protein
MFRAKHCLPFDFINQFISSRASGDMMNNRRCSATAGYSSCRPCGTRDWSAITVVGTHGSASLLVNGRKSDHQTVFVRTHCRASLQITLIVGTHGRASRQITTGNITHDTPCRGPRLNSVFIKFNIVPPKPIYACKKPIYTCKKPIYTCKKPIYTCKKPIYARKKPIYARKKPIYARKKPIYARKKPIYARKKPIYARKKQ